MLPDYGGRVGPYVIHYLSAGTPMPEEDVAAAHVDLRLTIMLTYVAGYSSDLEALLDRCQPWVYRWAPALPGLGVGHLSVPPGYDPGPARINEDVRPPRFWTPFQYNLDITT